MTKEEITVRVKQVLSDKLGHNESDIKDDSNIIEDLGSDSLDSVEIIMDIEDEFDIDIEDEEFNSVNTVHDLIHLVEMKL